MNHRVFAGRRGNFQGKSWSRFLTLKTPSVGCGWMRRFLLASLFLSSSHAFVLVPSAHAHPLAAPPSAHVHPLAALPLTRAHPLVARGGALSRGNEVMMILNPFSLFSIVLDALDPYPNDLDEMERVCPSHPAMHES